MTRHALHAWRIRPCSLGFGAPFFVRARLILQQLATEKFDWDTEVPQEFVKQWNSWLRAMELLKDFSLPRWYFADSSFCQVSDDVQYQPHAFSDASNHVFSSVVYLCQLINGVPCVLFVLGKCTIVLTNQSWRTIARKELVAALATAKLLKVAFDALKLPDCSKYFWCDSRSVLQWIKNPDLRVNKFIARRVDHILLLSDETDWRFCPKKMNAADVGSLPNLIVKADSQHLWLNCPSFLRQNVEVLVSELQDDAVVVAHKLNSFIAGRDKFDELITRAPSLYILSKRVAYLTAFVEFLRCRAKKCPFIKPVLNAAYLEEKVHLKELRSLRKYRPCVDEDGRVRIEGRLSKSPDFAVEAKHPLFIPSKHPLTRLVVMFYHTRDQHCGAQHTLLSTRQRFWIANGNAAIKRYLHDARCVRLKWQNPLGN